MPNWELVSGSEEPQFREGKRLCRDTVMGTGIVGVDDARHIVQTDEVGFMQKPPAGLHLGVSGSLVPEKREEGRPR